VDWTALVGFLSHAVTSRPGWPGPGPAGWPVRSGHASHSRQLWARRRPGPGRSRRGVGLPLTGGVLGALAEPHRPGTPAGFRLARGGCLRDRFRPDGRLRPGGLRRRRLRLPCGRLRGGRRQGRGAWYRAGRNHDRPRARGGFPLVPAHFRRTRALPEVRLRPPRPELPGAPAGRMAAGRAGAAHGQPW